MKRGRSLIFAGDDLCAIEQGFDIAAFEKPRLVPAVERRFKRGVDRIIANECSSDGKDRIQQVQSLVRGPPVGARDRHPTILPNEDRTSVVAGTSVSVRVDLGGRRISNKKKQ